MLSHYFSSSKFHFLYKQAFFHPTCFPSKIIKNSNFIKISQRFQKVNKNLFPPLGSHSDRYSLLINHDWRKNKNVISSGAIYERRDRTESERERERERSIARAYTGVEKRGEANRSLSPMTTPAGHTESKARKRTRDNYNRLGEPVRTVSGYLTFSARCPFVLSSQFPPRRTVNKSFLLYILAHYIRLFRVTHVVSTRTLTERHNGRH